MARKGGAPENLDPVRTKDEAKKRGRNGGVKSGEARRRKRDAKNAMNLLLDMAAKGQIRDNLKNLGVETEDQTNMVALQARLFTMAMGGNLQAYDRIMVISGNDPEENRRERESKAADKRKDAESKARVEALEHKDSMGQYATDEDPFGDEEKEDVVIVMPYTERDAKPPTEQQAVPATRTEPPQEPQPAVTLEEAPEEGGEQA